MRKKVAERRHIPVCLSPGDPTTRLCRRGGWWWSWSFAEAEEDMWRRVVVSSSFRSGMCIGKPNLRICLRGGERQEIFSFDGNKKWKSSIASEVLLLHTLLRLHLPVALFSSMMSRRRRLPPASCAASLLHDRLPVPSPRVELIHRHNTAQHSTTPLV